MSISQRANNYIANIKTALYNLRNIEDVIDFPLKNINDLTHAKLCISISMLILIFGIFVNFHLFINKTNYYFMEIIFIINILIIIISIVIFNIKCNLNKYNIHRDNNSNDNDNDNNIIHDSNVNIIIDDCKKCKKKDYLQILFPCKTETICIRCNKGNQICNICNRQYADHYRIQHI